MKEILMYEKRQNTFKSPDLKKLQEVVIDTRTRIYIEMEEDPEVARERYIQKFNFKKL
jgi:hypothetical protein